MTPDPIVGPVWVTQYALGEGILKFEEARHCMGVSDTLISVTEEGHHMTYLKPHWHTTEAEALARFEQMRSDAIKTAERKIKRLKSLKSAIIRSVKYRMKLSTGESK